jgi:hypothetical protein
VKRSLIFGVCRAGTLTAISTAGPRVHPVAPAPARVGELAVPVLEPAVAAAEEKLELVQPRDRAEPAGPRQHREGIDPRGRRSRVKGKAILMRRFTR